MENATSKTLYQSELFSNRILKRYKHLRKWARKNRISCYRLYDRDIPEVPLVCDIYTFLPENITSKREAAIFQNELNAAISKNDSQSATYIASEKKRTFVQMALYARPYEKPVEEENFWLNTMADTLSETLLIPRENVFVKLRKKLSGTEKGRLSQYEKFDSEKSTEAIVWEQGQIFKVNLSDYLDTGLFLDHRVLRAKIRMETKKKEVLNLFCYTGSFSVYAAEGGAYFVESVDLSNTYLEIAKQNMLLNDFTDESRYVFTRQDVVAFLKQKNQSKDRLYDLIILDPPTFSNSKNSPTVLDINRDWCFLIKECLSLLSPNGKLYFSTNSRRLVFKEELLLCDENSISIKDITPETIPEDFRNAKVHRVWLITKKGIL